VAVAASEVINSPAGKPRRSAELQSAVLAKQGGRHHSPHRHMSSLCWFTVMLYVRALFSFINTITYSKRDWGRRK